MASSVVGSGNVDRHVATLLAVERLAVIDEKPTKLSKWYEPGKDFCVYAGAQDACRASKAHLAKLKLSDDDRQLLSGPWEPDSVMKKIYAIQEEQERKAKRTKARQITSDFTNDFCKVAEQTSEIVKILLPQSPEYTVTWGLLTILFKCVVTKKEREESLNAYIKSLSAQLPLVSFYRDTYPTIAMKLVVARIFSEVVKLLEEALVYYYNGRLSKLVDAVWHPTEHKFDVYIASIEAEKKKLDELTKVANSAVIVDIQDVVKDTGKVAAALYESVEKSTFAIGISIEMLNQKMDSLDTRTSQMLKFEMLRYTQKLVDAIIPEGWDSEEQLALILHRGFRLSPKDHWEENGILSTLLTWSNNNRETLLWIGGSSGNQDPWVTELSVDLVQALQTQQLTLAYVFCNDNPVHMLTPIQLLKGLTVQMLTSDPLLAYGHSEVFHPEKFKRAVSFRQVWRNFEQLALKIPNLFIIIDRVEGCQPDELADVNDNLVPALIELASKTDRIRIIITSAYWPPDTVQGNAALEDVYIDTGRKPPRKK